jgi:hypothetical protein
MYILQQHIIVFFISISWQQINQMLWIIVEIFYKTEWGILLRETGEGLTINKCR